MSVAVNKQPTLPASHQYRTDPGPLVTRLHKGTSGGARSDVLDGSVQTVTRSARPISGDSEIIGYLTLLVSARPISCDSEISPGGCVVRLPVPWLLVPGPVAGAERLRADRACLRLEALMTWIGVQTPRKPGLAVVSLQASHGHGSCAALPGPAVSR